MMRWCLSLLFVLILLSPGVYAQEGGTPDSAPDSAPAAEPVVDQALIDQGESLFASKGCTGCHSIGDGDRGTGPDLMGVADRRDADWLARWIQFPDQMIAERDPVAVELLARFNQVPMPNMGVTEAETHALLAYIEAIGAQKAAQGAPASTAEPLPQKMADRPLLALVIFLGLISVISIIFWRIIRSTRDPVPTIDIAAAYRIRKMFFISACLVLGATLILTLFGTPYPRASQTPDQIIHVAAHQFAFAWTQDPVLTEADLSRVPGLQSVELSAGSLVEFRVTSLDVTHDFAIYRDDGSVLAQTQAMPGYVNRLLVRFDEPGEFNVFCLEYCGALHQAMRSSFSVR